VDQLRDCSEQRVGVAEYSIEASGQKLKEEWLSKEASERVTVETVG
jgi:hypothetical protein